MTVFTVFIIAVWLGKQPHIPSYSNVFFYYVIKTETKTAHTKMCHNGPTYWGLTKQVCVVFDWVEG